MLSVIIAGIFPVPLKIYQGYSGKVNKNSGQLVATSAEVGKVDKQGDITILTLELSF